MQDHDDRWLTTADLAARYHVPEVTVRYWRQRRTGPQGTLFGRRVLYREADLIAWEREKEAADPTRQPA
jgi:hypothetical protein